MAQKPRSIAVYILLGLLVIGLVGFGGATLTNSITAVAKVGDREVTANDYFNRVRGQIDAFARQIGTPVSFEQARSLGIDQAALASLVQEKALENEVARLGLSAGDERVSTVILSQTQFQALDGSFDRERYRQALLQQGTNERQFEDGIRMTMARQLLEAAVQGGAARPMVFAETIAAWRGETRDITWAVVEAGAAEAMTGTPDEAALQAHYDANPATYTTPELRRITYAWLSPEMIIDDVTVDPADVQAAYDARIEEFVMPERRLVERLIYPDEAAAEAALARMTDEGVTFEELVTERGLTLAATDMGDVGISDLGAAGEMVFAAGPGEVVGPAPTRLGPALFRINAVLSAQDVTLDQVADELRDELALQRAQRMIADQSEDLVDMLAGGATIEELTAATDMQQGEIAWHQGEMEGIAAYDAFRSVAAAATTEDFPELYQFDDGGVFVLRLDGIDPPALQPFDAVRDQVAEDLAAANEAEATLAEANRLAALIREGGFEAVPDLEPISSPGLRRSDFLEGTPEIFVNRVFALSPGEVGVLPHDGGAIIVSLDAVHESNPEDPAVAADLELIAAQAQQGINADLFAAFATQVQLNTDVRVDPVALDAIHAQMP